MSYDTRRDHRPIRTREEAILAAEQRRQEQLSQQAAPAPRGAGGGASAAAPVEEANGGLVAALVAAAIGSAALGLFVVLAEASETIGEIMTLNEGVGSLSGKTTFAALVYLGVWPLLHHALRDQEVDLSRALRLVAGLLGVAFLGTFPLFFQLFH
jgi:fluoride ion exporter CrcB/FEX